LSAAAQAGIAVAVLIVAGASAGFGMIWYAKKHPDSKLAAMLAKANGKGETTTSRI